MIGGTGNDTYYIDPRSNQYQSYTAIQDFGSVLPPQEDLILEYQGEGNDKVISVYDGYRLGANLEVLALSYYQSGYQSGVGPLYTYALSGYGNELDNQLYGNQADNILDGGAGADFMDGNYGNDIYYVDNTGDVVFEAVGDDQGIDTVYSSITYTLSAEVENLILTGAAAINAVGNDKNNILDGSQNAGANVLTGGLGDDTYVLGVGDSYVENTGEGNDTVAIATSYSLGNTTIENLILTGTDATVGIGTTSDNVLDGSQNAAKNILFGLSGNDTYVVDALDEIVENANDGVDTVVWSGTSYVLGANLESLTFAGINSGGTGNELDNLLVGNSTDNFLDGGAGADTMRGGNGNDTYVIDNIGDVVDESTSSGFDTVRVATSYTLTLASGIEGIVLTGSAAISATGDDENNQLDGSENIAANVLTGGFGNDTYFVGIGDVIVENGTGNLDQGFDIVWSNISYTLGANLENLYLTGTANLNATGNAYGNTLFGTTGANVLDGGAGADTLIGGLGDDTYVVDNIGDFVLEDSGSGIDTIQSYITLMLPTDMLNQEVENLTLIGTAAINGTGNTLDNVLRGNSAANVLKGAVGNDTYYVSTGDTVTENANEGTDTVVADVTWTLGSNLENLTLTGSSAINATGNTLNNTLTGNSASNTLSGGTGNDTMLGGAGNDTYVVDATSDVVTENASEGTDLVQSSVTYTLAANVENLTLTGTTAINATGNALDNILTGNTGTNTLTGGAGNDIYVIQNTTDVVVEAASAGTDTIQSSVTYTASANVENLTLTGTTAINATGNTLNNILTGNSAINILDGGTGADTLIGGAGNDTYVVDNAGDVVTENASEGTDLVQSSVTYTLAANVENLTLTGATAINGTGNTLANTLTGNSADNILDGGAGTDTMIGGTGNDSYVVDATTDVVTEAANAGTDTIQSSVTFTASANVENLTLTETTAINGTGNTLDNILIGNSATNTLTGGTGNDTYVIQNTTDVVVEAASAGTDTIQSSVTYTASANVENLTLTSTSAINATGNTLNNTLTGNSADNVLDGGTGTDTMIGGLGNDTYFVDATTDVVIEAASAGTDTIQSSVTYTASANVENLTLTGSSAINATGNALDNILTGNTGTNTLTGGAGNDTYIIQNTTDVVTEAASAGTDIIQSSVTYTASANVENLTLTGSTAINATGNTLSNVLTGNSANNTLTGGTGNDTYQFGRGGAVDTIVENDATAGNTDLALFASGIANDQLWFQHVGNNLEVSIIGTSDKLTIQNWYTGTANHVEQFKTSDNKLLLDTSVENLVQAMAAFSPPTAGQTTLPPAYQTTLAPVLAANWH